MNRLATFSLAAGAALLPASALAMQDAHLDASGAAAGVSWQVEAAAPAAMVVESGAPLAAQAAAAQGMHQVHLLPHPRVHRGWRMPPFWIGPRFRIVGWQHYGFAPPPQGWWWIRYYDDALLVGPDGIVRDGRYDVEWDRYGERWERDAYGVPSYVGRGDYAPGGDDYAYVESYEGPPGEAWAHAVPPPGYGSYGYSYGPVVVTETITTTTTTGPARAHKAHHEKRVAIHREVHRPSEADDDRDQAPPPPPPPPHPPRPLPEPLGL